MPSPRSTQVSGEWKCERLMQMLADNGKVSGHCVHLPVCNLQTVKSTENVSRLRESPLWEQLLPSTCAPELPFSPSRCPPSTKSGVGVYEDMGVILTTGRPCLSLNLKCQKLFPPWNRHLGGLVMGKSTEFWVRFGGRLTFWPVT